ncbi:MAG: rhomboid family intramembrane serine protease [Calditrichia bacterium]
MFPIKDDVQARSFPFVTIGLIFINTVIFFFEIKLSEEELKMLFSGLGIIPARYFADLPGGSPLKPEYIRLFTSMFLHGGWFHIIGNMWYLWIFGDNVEDRMGHGRFLIFYLLCGVGAGLTHIYLNPASTVPTIGASGAISGVMGAYFMLYPRARVLTLIPIFFFIEFIEVPAFFYLGIWALMQFFQGTVSFIAPEAAGGVAVWAHFGGFVIGMFLVFFFRKPKRAYRYYSYPDEYFPF